MPRTCILLGGWGCEGGELQTWVGWFRGWGIDVGRGAGGGCDWGGGRAGGGEAHDHNPCTYEYGCSTICDWSEAEYNATVEGH